MQSGKYVNASVFSDTSKVCLFRVAAIFMGGLVFAHLVDLADHGIVFATFLSIAGILRGTAAALGSDEFWAADLNRWDEAVLLTFASIVVYGLG